MKSIKDMTYNEVEAFFHERMSELKELVELESEKQALWRLGTNSYNAGHINFYEDDEKFSLFGNHLMDLVWLLRSYEEDVRYKAKNILVDFYEMGSRTLKISKAGGKEVKYQDLIKVSTMLSLMNAGFGSEGSLRSMSLEDFLSFGFDPTDIRAIKVYLALN